MLFKKSTPPPAHKLPRHVAIIMDGNGRWARARGLPRSLGHQAGVKSVRSSVETCARLGIEVLTLFAFSSENWKRPQEEVSALMKLFMQALDREVDSMHRNNIRVRFIGELSALQSELRERMEQAVARTAGNTGLTLVIAVGYGGRWDLVQAAQRFAADCVAGNAEPTSLTEAALQDRLQLAGLPDPDLFIRTGGERRISNFLLWNLAYTELYFCDALWPDFNEKELQKALHDFGERQRRFGLTEEQLGSSPGANVGEG